MLLDALKDLKLDTEEKLELARLASILGLSSETTTSVFTAAAGPLYQNVAKAAADSGEGGAELRSALDNLGLPRDIATSIAVDLYTDKLLEFTGGSRDAFDGGESGKILREEQSDKLTALRDLLDLEMAQVYEVHERYCSAAYADSIREVIGGVGETDGGALSAA